MEKSQDETDFSTFSESDQHPLLNEKTVEDTLKERGASSINGFYFRYINIGLFLLLLVSVAANIASLVYTVIYKGQVTPRRSTYADLPNNHYIPFEWATDYATENLTLAAELWDGINFDPGFVALPYDWTESKRLPRAQAFPWDKSQGLYVLNGYHALHCLVITSNLRESTLRYLQKNIHQSIRQYHLGLQQSLPLMHITHCMDALRSDILCQADDTPRYTTITKSPESAVGQLRQCRNWAMLEKWAKERTSCYNYISAGADHIDQFERFKFCPPNSPYWPAVRKHFGKDSDWIPVRGDDITLEEGFEKIH